MKDKKKFKNIIESLLRKTMHFPKASQKQINLSNFTFFAKNE